MLVIGSGNADRFASHGYVTSNTPIVAITDIRNINSLSLQLCTTDHAGVIGGSGVGTTLAGTWKVEISNSVSLQPDQLQGGQSSDGAWTDITADFDPAIPAAVSGTSQKWPVTMNAIGYRHLRITFTPTNGNTFNAGNKQRVAAYLVGKDFS